jgi:hypothetical protein
VLDTDDGPTAYADAEETDETAAELLCCIVPVEDITPDVV